MHSIVTILYLGTDGKEASVSLNRRLSHSWARASARGLGIGSAPPSVPSSGGPGVTGSAVPPAPRRRGELRTGVADRDPMDGTLGEPPPEDPPGSPSGSDGSSSFTMCRISYS